MYGIPQLPQIHARKTANKCSSKQRKTITNNIPSEKTNAPVWESHDKHISHTNTHTKRKKFFQKNIKLQ